MMKFSDFKYLKKTGSTPTEVREHAEVTVTTGFWFTREQERRPVTIGHREWWYFTDTGAHILRGPGEVYLDDCLRAYHAQKAFWEEEK
jgi:hypothetical protein